MMLIKGSEEHLSKGSARVGFVEGEAVEIVSD